MSKRPKGSSPRAQAVTASPKKDTTTTAAVLPIARIDGPVIERSDGMGFAVIITVQGILFDLLSPDEKDAILSRYQSLLHSVQSPIQVIMQSIPMRLDDEIAHFRQVAPQYPDDPRPVFAEAIATLLDEYTEDLEQPLYLYVATGPTEAQARREADALANGLRFVHPDLQPRYPSTSETMQILSLCAGMADLSAPMHTYRPPWAGIDPQEEGGSVS